MKRILRLLAASALVAGAFVVVSQSTASATAPCTRTYSTVDSKNIVDHTVASSLINVPEDGLAVTDANVTVNIHHTAVSDLSIILQSEGDGSQIRGGATLYNQTTSGDDMLGTTFDSQSANAIATAEAPYSGTFAPVSSLSEVNGFAGGQYRLVVWDHLGGDEGTIDSWSITLTYATCDVDGDGLDVPADLCPNQAAATASGCPVATRAVTAKYKTGKFRGAISSSAAKCRSGMKVVIWKARAGTDRKIGTVTTKADGTYRLTRARHAGKYYATSAKVVVPNAAECRAVTSATFRIK
jgi:subtilisin-like proprotein convertase family protein